LFQKEIEFSKQLNKRVSYKQIGKVVEFAMGDFIESKFMSNEFEKYVYKETTIARSSFKTKDSTATISGYSKFKNYFLNKSILLS
jgi:hypothetical protein